MSRILSLFFIFSMLLPCLFILTACKGGNDPVTPPATPPQPPEEKAPALYLPTAGSFEGHSTENFSNFVYSAPSTEALLSALALATERLESEETSYDSALATITALEQVYAEFTSMLSYAQIRYSSNSADAYFSGEYKRLYAALPTVSFALEKLFSAVSASPHGAALSETEYFSSDIVERYKNGGIYTEQTLPLFEEETQLLLEADNISYDTVKITYKQITDTAANVLAQIAVIYGEDSAEYQQAHMSCVTLYKREANKKRADLYLSLLAVRREIADALGYESYAHLSSERLGYSATPGDVHSVLAAVEAYLLPVYQQLSASDYFRSNTGKVEKIKFAEQTLNTLTHFYEAKGGKLFEGYNYLLHRSLYSIGNATDERASGAFAAHFYNRDQPFLYVGMGGTAADYLTAADALGDALCFYYNNTKNGAFASLFNAPEISDAYGLSLRLLTLQGMKEALSKTESSMEDSTYLILLKQEMYNAFQIMLTQCMRTQIEWEAYALRKEEITLDRVNEIIARAADRFDCFEIQNGAPVTLSLSTENLLSTDMLHTPCHTFSELTSVYVAVSLYAKEAATSGAGFAAFDVLLTANAGRKAYTEVLSALSLQSPADSDAVRTLATTLYEVLTGYAYNGAPHISAALGKA